MKTVANSLSSLKFSVWLMPLFCLGCATMTPESRQAESTLVLNTSNIPAQYDSFASPQGLSQNLSPEGDLVENQIHLDDAVQYAIAKQEEIAPRQEAWWTDFNSQDLNALIETSLATNFDIAKAWATLRQSEATLREARSGLFPSLDGSASTSTEHSSSRTKSTSRVENTSNNFGLGLAASYEVDFWGRINADEKAEWLRLQATALDLETARMTVAASVATAWTSLLGNRAELAVVHEQIAINTDIATLQQVRFMNGLSTSLDVLQQQEAVAALHAIVPSLEQERVVLSNELDILQGVLPSMGLPIDEGAPLPHIGAIPAMGLPIQLLDARPDIQAAWARLEAADWDVTKAHANRYPSITLSASMLFSLAESSLLIGNWISSLAASLAMPIYDGGALAAEEERVRAVAEELLQNYANTVATAMQEVGNALATEQGEKATLQRLEEQLLFAMAARDEARNSYLGGATDFLNYITELKNVQSLERSIAQQKTTVVQARITLNRTLGGLTFPQEMNALSVK